MLLFHEIAFVSSPGLETHEWLSEKASSYVCGGNLDFSHGGTTMSAHERVPEIFNLIEEIK
jgi:hypothetical protein